MRGRTPRYVAAGSVALLGGGLVLAYVDRHLVPASLANWTVSNISGQVVSMAVPVTGFVLAARRPQNPLGWLFLAAGLALGLSGPVELTQRVRECARHREDTAALVVEHDHGPLHFGAYSQLGAHG